MPAENGIGLGEDGLSELFAEQRVVHQQELYRHCGITVEAIVAAAEAINSAQPTQRGGTWHASP